MSTAAMPHLPDDLLAIRAELMCKVEADARRGRYRRRLTRTTCLSVAVAVAVSATAVGAGAALGVIDLGAGVQAQQVETYPAYNVVTHKLVQVPGGGLYVYHLTGAHSNLSACPENPADVYVESAQPLDAAQLKLAGELATGLVRESPEEQSSAIPGLKGLSNGCGDAGVERTVGQSPSTPE